MRGIRSRKGTVLVAWIVLAVSAIAVRAPSAGAQVRPTATLGGFIILKTNTPTTGSIIIPPTKTPTPRITPTWTPTRRITPTDTPKITDTPTATTGSVAQPTEPIGDLTVASPTPTLPSFAIPTPTPIVDPFDFPPGDLTGPIPTATLPQLLGPGEVPDLEITNIEITQGMQNLDNDMPLVAGRMTFLRVYVKTDGADYPNVKLLVQGTRGGQPIGVLVADNQPITAKGDGGDRVNVNDSFYVQLPSSWTDPGSLSLDAFAYAGNPQAPFTQEPDATNNFYSTSGDFDPGSALNVSFVPIHLHENYDGSQPEKLYTQSNATFWTIVVGMLRHLPLSGFQLYAPPFPEIYCYAMSGEVGIYAPGQTFGEHGDCEFNLNVPGGEQYVNVMMALMKLVTDPPAQHLYYYGMVDPDFDSQMTFYKSDGTTIHFTGLSLYGAAYGQMDGTVNASSPWMIAGAETLAHEFGHRLELKHVNCKGNESAGGGVDDNYPWPGPPPDCSIAEVDEEGFYGFDVWYMAMPGVNEPTVISNDPSAPNPNRGFPLMGYQKPQFEDAYDWCLLLDETGTPCDWSNVILAQEDSAGPRLASLRLAPPSASSLLESTGTGFGGFDLQTAPFLVVTGQVQLDPVEAKLGELITLPRPPANPLTDPENSAMETGFELALLDANGQVLATQPIQQTTINHEVLNPLTFVTGLALPEGASHIQIRHAGETVADRRFSDHAPQVKLLAPNGGEVFQGPFEVRWQGSDEDDDSLVYTLQYSPDNGQTWQALALGLTGESYPVLSLYNLTGSDQGLIRVLASDGTNTGMDVSDGTFTIPNSPPMPAIESPGHLAVFPVGGLVSLRGAATDREDGVLPSESLTWESSLDGFIGTGDTLEVNDLSPGNHVITLTAEDSQGTTAQAQVGIVVDANWVRSVPDDDELALASQILAAGPDAAPPAGPDAGPPAAAEAQAPQSLTPLFLVLGAAVVLGLIALAMFIPLLRGRRR